MTRRKVKPLSGHTCLGIFRKVEVACECGWNSCAHTEWAEAYSEWRDHILSHGGKYAAPNENFTI